MFDVMAALYRAPEGLRMSALSRALLVSNGNVTSIVRQLQTQSPPQHVTALRAPLSRDTRNDT